MRRNSDTSLLTGKRTRRISRSTYCETKSRCTHRHHGASPKTRQAPLDELDKGPLVRVEDEKTTSADRG
jgi:hypothetical protein